MGNNKRKQDILDVVKEAGISIEEFERRRDTIGGYQVYFEDYMSSGDRSILKKLKKLIQQPSPESGSAYITGSIIIK